jgi:hypothetical protein
MQYVYHTKGDHENLNTGIHTHLEMGDTYGWFERWRPKGNHDDFVSSGGLWFEQQDGVVYLTDYDGVYDLPADVASMLKSWGVKLFDHTGT